MPWLQSAIFFLLEQFPHLNAQDIHSFWAKCCVPLTSTNLAQGQKTTELTTIRHEFVKDIINYITPETPTHSNSDHANGPKTCNPSTKWLHPNTFRMLCLAFANKELASSLKESQKILNEVDNLIKSINTSEKNSVHELIFLNELFACKLIFSTPTSIKNVFNPGGYLITTLAFKLSMSEQPKAPFKDFHKNLEEKFCNRTLSLTIKQCQTPDSKNNPFAFYEDPKIPVHLSLALLNNPKPDDFSYISPGHHQNIVAHVLPLLIQMHKTTEELLTTVGEKGHYQLQPKNSMQILPERSFMWRFNQLSISQNTDGPDTNRWLTDIPIVVRQNVNKSSPAPSHKRKIQNTPLDLAGYYLRLICKSDTPELGDAYNSGWRLIGSEQEPQTEEIYLCPPTGSDSAPQVLDFSTLEALLNVIINAIPNKANVIIFTPPQAS
jgi:hypothetical protein